jgi:hypothetical protein
MSSPPLMNGMKVPTEKWVMFFALCHVKIEHSPLQGTQYSRCHIGSRNQTLSRRMA